eukprot:scaffold141907_cov18-Tisochrysis_lutea.AAC.3
MVMTSPVKDLRRHGPARVCIFTLTLVQSVSTYVATGAGPSTVYAKYHQPCVWREGYFSSPSVPHHNPQPHVLETYLRRLQQEQDMARANGGQLPKKKGHQQLGQDGGKPALAAAFLNFKQDNHCEHPKAATNLVGKDLKLDLRLVEIRLAEA